MKKILAKTFKYIIGDWEIFYIFKKKITPVNYSPSSESFKFVEKRINDEYYRMSIMGKDEEICSLFVIWGNEYKYNFRNYIPLRKNEAKITDVVTAKSYRGKGYIGKLLIHTEHVMLNEGIDTLLARIWHSNESSKRAFKKGNWEYSGYKLKMKLFHKIPLGFTTHK